MKVLSNLTIILVVVILCSTSAQLAAEPLPDLTTTELELVERTRVGRTVFEYEYKVTATNVGQTVSNVTGEISSSAANLQIIDPIATFALIEEEGSAQSDDTVVIRVNRAVSFNPSDLAWSFEGDLESDEAVLTLNTSPASLDVDTGTFTNIATSLLLEGVSTEEESVIITQSVFPPTGLDLAPEIDGTSLDAADGLATVFNQELFAALVGNYAITTTATLSESGSVVEAVTQVSVTSNDALTTLQVLPPAFTAGALSLVGTTDTSISVRVTGVPSSSIISVNVVDVVSGVSFPLADDGVGGDLVAANGVFAADINLSADGLAAGECLNFVALATTTSGVEQSDPTELCVSAFPVELEPITEETIDANGFDGPGGIRVSSELVRITLTENATLPDIQSFLARIQGQVIGTLPVTGLLQIRLESPPVSLEDLVFLVTGLVQEPVVANADLVYLTEQTFAYIPDDPQLISQRQIDNARVDEAWYVARGTGQVIAVVDTGVDLDHPDLLANVLAGKDFVDGDLFADDEHGHGTHVAGIAAAVTNNTVGVAGVASDSRILPVRVLGSNGSGEISGITAGIIWAASRGADVINLSLGYQPEVDNLLCKLQEFFGIRPPGSCLTEVLNSPGTVSAIDQYCKAVAHAVGQGAIVVVAAGNSSTQNRSYPAACAGAFAVAAINGSDSKASFSNSGQWVDIAALGVDLRSTIPPTPDCNFCAISNFFGFTNRVDLYALKSGTSMAAPVVSGVAALVKSRSSVPMARAAVETRLIRTARKLSNSDLGAGAVDAFEAVFNGGFEEGNLALWDRFGTVGSFSQLGTLTPQDGDRMGYVSTGPADARTAGSLSQSFVVQPGVVDIPISFTYAFISEEFPEFVNTAFDDSLSISLTDPSGNITELARESINSSAYFPLTGSGLDFPGGDSTIGWTGWKTVSQSVPVSSGPGVYMIELQDAGDSIYDTVLLIDAINFK